MFGCKGTNKNLKYQKFSVLFLHKRRLFGDFQNVSAAIKIAGIVVKRASKVYLYTHYA